VNGEPLEDIDPRRNDVNITGYSGHLVVEAEF
jgi:hypothetical protein